MPKEQEAKALMCLLDAVIDRDAMDCSLKEEIFPPAIFHAQQASEKASKACLILLSDYREGHDYTYDFKLKIIPVAGELSDEFTALNRNMAKLESLCVQSRYSVSQRSIRNRLYPRERVLELCESSRLFLELCFGYLEVKMKMVLPRDRDGLRRFILSKYRVYIDDVSLD